MTHLLNQTEAGGPDTTPDPAAAVVQQLIDQARPAHKPILEEEKRKGENPPRSLARHESSCWVPFLLVQAVGGVLP